MLSIIALRCVASPYALLGLVMLSATGSGGAPLLSSKCAIKICIRDDGLVRLLDRV